MKAEEWRPVAEAPGYEVSDQGRVRSWRATGRPLPHVLKTSVRPDGYLSVSLQLPERRQVGRKVHRIVTDAFLGPLPAGMITRHLDGNRTNNVAANLAYGTYSENELDKVAHGTHAMSAKTHCPAGHPYDEQNTRVYRRRRRCLACGKQARAARRLMARAAA